MNDENDKLLMKSNKFNNNLTAGSLLDFNNNN